MLSKLPPRERQIVDILYERGPLPVTDICDVLPDQLSGSAVRAMLKRLENKGYVSRSESDRGFLYSPLVSDSVAKKSALSDIVKTFFNGSPASAASALLGMSDRIDGRRARRARENDRPRTQGQRGQIMYVLIGIALKSLIIAGATLGLLELTKRRSAAERSWVAHIGLFALVTLALAPLVMPSWTIEAPAFLGQATPTGIVSHAAAPVASAPLDSVKQTVPVAAAAAPKVSVSPVAAATAFYAVPAAILLLITLLALLRLVALRARADVLVDGHWLSALARAQRRMGFKHGTALLTSNELASPISWGLMRPVILLNTRAVEASGEAEAIIAHELAHVARMDWVKLLLARVATALFWFNPLVWMLAREAHQLREEAADDSVLAADIVDTDYAQLLVGVARHECPGLLLGAHGVAPSKGSLARRVARVLDALRFAVRPRGRSPRACSSERSRSPRRSPH